MTPTSAQPPIHEEVDYPSGDREPMAETDIHVVAIMLLFQALEDFFQAHADVYISANSFWYWEKGNPNARCAPDIKVVPGVGNRHRRSFMSWKEGGAVPCTIFEVCSKKNWRENLNDKRQLYAELGVKEYFLFDPEAIYLPTPLLGYRLHDQAYVSLAVDSEDRPHSIELGLLLKAEGEMLRLSDAKTGEPILTRKESERKARQQAEQSLQQVEQTNKQAEQVREYATALEAEVARLKALLNQKQNSPGNGTRPTS